jgi:hypothetical protein
MSCGAIHQKLDDFHCPRLVSPKVPRNFQFFRIHSHIVGQVISPSGFVKILKFKVLRPLVAAGEKPSAGEFDVELEVDSGGSEDKELFKLLLKVRKSLD